MGRRQVQRLVQVDGFDVDVELADHVVVMTYHDRPGVVAELGRVFGDAGVNIAGMQVSRQREGEHAVAVLVLDAAADAELVESARVAVEAHEAVAVTLGDG